MDEQRQRHRAGRITPGAELMWSAGRVVESHADGAGCRWCRPDGACRLRDWAADLLVEWERRGRRVPDPVGGVR